MAKQNRRINIAKREARELRAQLAREKSLHRAETEELRETIAHLAEAGPSAPASLDTIIERLRAMCRDTFCLPARNQQSQGGSPYFYRMRLPEPVADFIERGCSRDFVQREELVQFVLRFSENVDRGFLARYAHLRITGGGRNRMVALAVTPDALRLMSDHNVAAQWVAEEFGRAIACNVRTEALA